MAGVLLTAVPLLACGGGAESTRIARHTYAVECKRNRTNCYEEAARVCPDGFDVLDGSSQRGAVIVGQAQTATVVPTYSGDLLVRCHPPDRELADRPQADPEAHLADVED